MTPHRRGASNGQSRFVSAFGSQAIVASCKKFRRDFSGLRKQFRKINSCPICCTGPVCGRLDWFGRLNHSLGAMERGGFIMAEDNKSYGLAWFLAGLGVGALVGILYAPKSGKE